MHVKVIMKDFREENKKHNLMLTSDVFTSFADINLSHNENRLFSSQMLSFYRVEDHTSNTHKFIVIYLIGLSDVQNANIFLLLFLVCQAIFWWHQVNNIIFCRNYVALILWRWIFGKIFNFLFFSSVIMSMLKIIGKSTVYITFFRFLFLQFSCTHYTCVDSLL